MYYNLFAKIHIFAKVMVFGGKNCNFASKFNVLMMKLILKRGFLLTFCILVSVGLHAQKNDTTTIKRTIPSWMSTLKEKIEVHGYAQAGYTWRHQDGINNNTFDIKRVLFWAKANVTDRWSFLFMHDFSSVVQEFYTDYRFSRGKEFSVRFGQFKNSLSMQNPLSPTKLDLIDCYSQSVLYLTGCGTDPLNGVQYGRDLGLMLYGDLFNDKLHYEFAVMNGSGINRKDNNNYKDVIGKLEYRFKSNFRVVATGQLGKGHALEESIYCPDIKVGEDYTRNRWSLGAEWKEHTEGVDYWKNRTAQVQAEVLGGQDGNNKSIGAYATVCVPVWKGLDVIASADYFNYNRELGMGQMNFVGGVQYWFYKTCRVQLQYTNANPAWEKHYGNLQAQVQVAF